MSRELRKSFDEVLIHTGQHYDYMMSTAFFEELPLPAPDYNLEVGSGTHGRQTGRMLERLEGLLMHVRPSLVIVYGDTNSTLAGALAATKLEIPVAHIEAGVRSFDRTMPEEHNRVLTDHLSSRLFVPTELAVGHLSQEGITEGVVLSGDVMCDALLEARSQASRRRQGLLRKWGVEEGQYVLATVHRAANTDDVTALVSIMEGLALATLPIVFPCHPRTLKALSFEQFAGRQHVHIIEPLSYLDMLAAEEGAAVIATDSGGVQKEAYMLGVPCVTLRNSTEWMETVEAGWNRVVGTDPSAIAEALQAFRPTGAREEVFGGGQAAALIAENLASYLQYDLKEASL